MLCLRLELLTGRYCASRFDDRDAAEWPPHPARVFSALVAAHYDGDATDAGADALRWLERQPPPDLHFSELSPGKDEVRVQGPTFVPVNDKAISDAATVNTAWGRVFAATSEKASAKAEAKLRDAYRKAAAAQDKVTDTAVAQARRVLPDGRTRQARTFPTVVPADPVVQLVWDSEASEQQLEALKYICRTLSRVGHSSSMVAASWHCTAPEDPPTWHSSSAGDVRLRWVCEGQLAALDALHTRTPFGEQRVMPYTVARYATRQPKPFVPSSTFGSEFVVLRKKDGRRVSLQDTPVVAEVVRAALMSHAPQPVDPVISGHHGEAGSPRGDHLAIIPIPYVGSKHANGDILGIALVLPAAATTAQRQALFAAIRHWEASGSQLVMGKLGKWTLERQVDESKLQNLREPTWCRPSRDWVSATPVLFDRHPGDIGDRKPGRRRAALRKSNEIIRDACKRIGLPEPEEIEFSHAPFLQGSAMSRDFRSPARRRDPRPKLHVRLRFAEPIGGPILLGAGRFRGLGLFRPQLAPGAVS